MPAAPGSSSPPTERVVAIVGLLTEQPERGFTLSEIAAELDLSIATCHAITTVLVGHGYLLRSAAGKAFTLGPALLTAGRAAETAMPAARAARARVGALGAQLGVEAVASTVVDDAITVVEWAPPPEGIPAATHLGQRIPFNPPFGAVHAAWAEAAVVERWLQRAPRTAQRELHGLLDAIRERGYDVHRDDAAAGAFRRAATELGRDGLSAEARDAVDVLLRELAGVEHLPVRFDRRRTYRVNTISSAVIDARGTPVLTLSLLFHRPMSGAEIEAAGTALLSGAGHT